MPKKAEPTGFGLKLKELREAAGLSQQELADRIGFHKLSVAKIEQGIREPTWSSVKAISEALGVSCEAFNQPAATDSKPSGPGRPPRIKPEAPTPKPTKPAQKKPKK